MRKFLLAAVAVVAVAVSAHAEPKRDILGFHPGMSYQEAMSAMAKVCIRSGLTVLVSLMESSFLIEAVNTSILRTGALHCYHYYTLSTGYRPLGSCSRAAGWSAATSCHGPTRTFAYFDLMSAD